VCRFRNRIKRCKSQAPYRLCRDERSVQMHLSSSRHTMCYVASVTYMMHKFRCRMQSKAIEAKQLSYVATKRLTACRPTAARNSPHIAAISIVQGVILIRPVVSLIDPIRSWNIARASLLGGPSQQALCMTDVTSYACLSLCVAADVTCVVLSIGKMPQLRRRHRHRQTCATILTIISASHHSCRPSNGWSASCSSAEKLCYSVGAVLQTLTLQ